MSVDQDDSRVSPDIERRRPCVNGPGPKDEVSRGPPPRVLLQEDHRVFTDSHGNPTTFVWIAMTIGAIYIVYHLIRATMEKKRSTGQGRAMRPPPPMPPQGNWPP